MRILLSLVVILLAGAGGIGAGLFVRPPANDADGVEAEATDASHDAAAEPSIVELTDTFIVPILRDGRVWSHAVLSLGIESGNVGLDAVRLREPVLRDALNEALFRHGSLGGFDGDFTDPLTLNRLRTALNHVVRQRMNDDTARVLIMGMSRQGR